jgi:hypothetical protein
MWLPKNRRAVLWILAHFVFFRASNCTLPTMMDYVDFMRRARWKAQNVPKRQCFLGKYLEVL